MQKPTLLIVLLSVFLTSFLLLAKAATGDLITGWALVAPVPQPIAYHRAVASDDKILMIGGEVPVWTTPMAPLFQAKVENDGSIKQWSTPVTAFATRLPAPLHRHALVQVVQCVTNVLYIIGGFSNGNRYGQVWRTYWDAPSGQLSGWTEARNYPRKIILHEALYVKNRIYVLGGLDEADQPLDEAYSAEVYGNGDLAAWRAETKLPKPLYRFAVVAYGNNGKEYLYVIGGYDGKDVQQTIYRAEIDAAGSWRDWKRIGSLPRSLAYHRALIVNDQLIVLGGTGTDGSYNEVYRVLLTDDDKVGEWHFEADLPDSISRFAAITVTLPDRQMPLLYVIGGANGDNFRAQVYHSLPLVATPALYTTILSAPGSSAIYLPIVRRCS